MRKIAEPKCRILYLTKLFPYPPAVTGDTVYSRGVIEAWSSAADLTVICADSGADQCIGANNVDWRIVRPVRSGRAQSVLSRWPLIAWKGATPDYLAELDGQLESGSWDAVVLDNLGTAHALPRVEAYRKAHPAVKVLYISHEWEYQARAGKYDSYRMRFPARLMAQLDLRKVKHWEAKLITRCDIVTVITESDLVPFRAIDPDRKYLPVSPGYDGKVVQRRTISATTPRRVLMLGGRRSEQKQRVLLAWLAAAYSPLVQAGIEIAIVGDITDDLRQLVLREYPRCQILGYVEDLESLVAEARCGVIADTVGGGFKLRLLSLVFHRLPIVGLAEAITGLPTPEGSGYLTSPSLEELGSLICESIDNFDLLNSLQSRAYNDCLQAFSWNERALSLTEAVKGQGPNNLV